MESNDPQTSRYRYERPNDKWICGKAPEGQACRLGPDYKGRCRASTECTPRFEKKEGEAKGRYHCTRPKEYGGSCVEGPLPNGECGRPVTRCQPLPSLRRRRGALSFAVLTATVGLLLVVLNSPSRLDFLNPGTLSSVHSGENFMNAHGGRFQNRCAACHANATNSTAGWLTSAFAGDFDFSGIARMAEAGAPGMHRIDQACLACHKGHDFHHRNVQQMHSCSLCHPEHRGLAMTRDPGDGACARCHNDANAMARAHAAVFASFASGHPEFWTHAGHKEMNALRFNHQRHFETDIPLIEGQPLDCSSCHEPDATGFSFQQISFKKHCQACHSLQFDRRNPSLHVPHGDPANVRAFLRSLPAQYADLARNERGLIQQREVDRFVLGQLTTLRDETQTEENLEQRVFFGGERAEARACILCHEMGRASNVSALPGIAPITFRALWFPRSEFDHAKHRSAQCIDCHSARESNATADILMPPVKACQQCHSPAGGAAFNCTLCHDFHREQP